MGCRVFIRYGLFEMSAFPLAPCSIDDCINSCCCLKLNYYWAYDFVVFVRVSPKSVYLADANVSFC